MCLTSSEHKKKCWLRLTCSKLTFHLIFSEEKKSVLKWQRHNRKIYQILHTHIYQLEISNKRTITVFKKRLVKD